MPTQTVIIIGTQLRCVTGQVEERRASFHLVLVKEEALKVLLLIQNKEHSNKYLLQILLRRTLVRISRFSQYEAAALTQDGGVKRT